jgi:hypothetical protein
MTCECCAAEEPRSRWNINCDDCCLRKIREAPDRNARRQVLVAVRMRRGRGAEERIRKLVESAWTAR